MRRRAARNSRASTAQTPVGPFKWIAHKDPFSVEPTRDTTKGAERPPGGERALPAPHPWDVAGYVAHAASDHSSGASGTPWQVRIASLLVDTTATNCTGTAPNPGRFLVVAAAGRLSRAIVGVVEFDHRPA